MNIGQLQKNIGRRLRLRPLPIRIANSGTQLPASDDAWRLDDVLLKPTRVMLSNPATGHVLELQSDNVREYRSPDFLLLKCQLTITASGISIEPTHAHDQELSRLEQQMPELLSEMRDDIAAHKLRREVVLLERGDMYWAGGDELVYYFDDHPELANKFHILSNLGLVRDITFNTVARYQISEKLAQYLGG